MENEQKKKSMAAKVFNAIIASSGVLAVLFWVGKALIESTELEYRFIPDLLGKANTFLLLPILLVLFLLKAIWIGKENRGIFIKIGKVFGSGAIVIALIIWCFLSFWGVLFTLEEDYRVSSKILTVNKGGFPQEDSYEVYQPIAGILRKPQKWGKELSISYLEEKYAITFYKEGNGDNTEIHPEGNENITVNVWIEKGLFEDNYIPQLTTEYFLQYYKKENMSRKYLLQESLYPFRIEFLLQCTGKEDFRAFSRDASKLIELVMQDKMLEQYECRMKFYIGTDSEKYIGYLPFGKLNEWSEIKDKEYYEEPSKIEQIVADKYEEMLEYEQKTLEYAAELKARHAEAEIEQKIAQEAKQEAKQEVKQEVKQGTAEDIIEGNEADEINEYKEIEIAAKQLYEKEFEKTVKEFEISYSVKGNLYVDLEEGTSEINGEIVKTKRNITYDRISKNGLCYLFVYYQDYYYDDSGQHGDTSILDFYAVDRITGEVIAAKKTSWEAVGKEEYRNATGE